MTATDDDRWLDALGGRAVGDSATEREASALRAAMLSRASVAADVAQTDAARERALIERARREGIVSRGARPVWGSLAAAAVLVLAAGIWFIDRPQNDAFAVRSAPDGAVRIEADDPVGLKRTMLAELRAAGIDARGYERLGKQGIDADLPESLTAAQRRVLDTYQLVAPEDGVLRVEIVGRNE